MYLMIKRFLLTLKVNSVRISLVIVLSFLVMMESGNAQSYFPANGQPWETVSFAEAGWCSDSLSALIEYLDQEDTKAFIVLQDGRIIIEHYFDSFTSDSLWYWASAGKTLTSSLVGIAESEGYLNIDSTVSTYLTSGWSSMTIDQEDEVTVRHQLTMTTGLNENVSNDDCTLPSCLEYLAEPGTRWAYHNAPYSLLYQVLQSATGFNMNQFFSQKIGIPCGISGLYFPSGSYNQTFVSTPRNMAKFSLLLQSQGVWNGAEIIPSSYFQSMITPSQDINQAYGYLTWLNGSSSFMIPDTQIQFPGMMAPSAPEDTYAGLGKNGQVVSASPSKNVSFIRMGNGNNELVSVTILENIWKKMKWFFCSNEISEFEGTSIQVLNNGQRPIFQAMEGDEILVFSTAGQQLNSDLYQLEPGLYLIHFKRGNHTQVLKWLVGEN
jgi:CubicO group peptidase (beta-lactamase class C family)